ncbi:hypothetical protein RSOLAG1IB_10076 [Rhizoctonia solani AG-1 IB]|uniref:Uncharacterized protein n=1 Tax=Thanatephorus cucumeris (strain AG1-IB / isolate 7/3/14) TaxID=1108050 RepID=A0A0B7FZ11_THACB|nr:hypothetical protein RSOLAG1IB_10076 [Rhizoctonia solani AG-1 IB]
MARIRQEPNYARRDRVASRCGEHRGAQATTHEANRVWYGRATRTYGCWLLVHERFDCHPSIPGTLRPRPPKHSERNRTRRCCWT